LVAEGLPQRYRRRQSRQCCSTLQQVSSSHISHFAVDNFRALLESGEAKDIESNRKNQMANVALRLILSFSLVLIAPSLFGMRPGDFKVLGPGGGGAMFNPTISPHDPNTVLISCDMTGSYITHDGGQSWRMFNLRGVVRFFVFDPRDPKVMYAQATGLWRSNDGGETWNLVYPNPHDIKSVVMNSDHSDEILVADSEPMGLVSALSVDPSDSNTLYAAGDKKHLALFISRDGGKSWQRKESLPEVPRRIWVDPKSSTSRTLYFAGARFIVMKGDSGMHEFPAPESVSFTDVSVGFGSGSGPTIYGVSEKGLFVSGDGGKSWQAKSLPGSKAKVRAVGSSLRNGNVAYVSYSDLSLN
jgi:hypothetical protein